MKRFRTTLGCLGLLLLVGCETSTPAPDPAPVVPTPAAKNAAAGSGAVKEGQSAGFKTFEPGK